MSIGCAQPTIDKIGHAKGAYLPTVSVARDLARALLARSLPQRWHHVQAVAERAGRFQPAYRREEARLLVVAAYLHDVGYAPSLKDTGFHPIDGAAFLRGRDVDERIVNLVAHHSCACIEAGFHGLDQRLAREFPRDDALPHDALLYCDLSTGPSGEPLSLDARLIDIRRRYGPDHIVTRFIDRAEPDLRAAFDRAANVLAGTLVAV